MVERYNFRFPASFQEIRRIEASVFPDIEARGCPKEDLLNIRLALGEALANAIRHGCREDPSKMVTLEVFLEDTCIRFRIEDEGNGFDYTGIPDPREKARLHEPAGRGLFLIRKFCDAMVFNDKGNVITVHYIVGQRRKDREGGFHQWTFNETIVYEFFRQSREGMVRSLRQNIAGMMEAGRRHFVMDFHESGQNFHRWRREIEECALVIEREGGKIAITGVPEGVLDSDLRKLRDLSQTNLTDPLNAGIRAFNLRRKSG